MDKGNHLVFALPVFFLMGKTKTNTYMFFDFVFNSSLNLLFLIVVFSSSSPLAVDQRTK